MVWGTTWLITGINTPFSDFFKQTKFLPFFWSMESSLGGSSGSGEAIP
jgi:hypothetical protein